MTRDLKAELPGLFTELILLMNRSELVVPATLLHRGLETLRPDAVVTHLLDGMIATKSGRHADAEKSYRRLLELDPDNHGGKAFLAESLIGQERWDDARPLVLAVLGDGGADESTRAFAQELQQRMS